MKMKNKIIGIIVVLIFVLMLILPVTYAQQPGETQHQSGDTTTIGGKEYTWEGCANGSGGWECTGNSCNGEEKEPIEREPPAPQPPLSNALKPNPQWTSVLGYANSFNQCSNLCAAYQQSNCDISSALAYCSAIVSIDLNRNGKISANQIGTTPSGTQNCDTNVRCYDVIQNCSCGNQQLNLGSCISLFYQELTNAGLSSSQALSDIAQSTSANCHTVAG